MENNVIKDRRIASVDKENDNRVRFVCKVVSIDQKIGTFEVEDGTGKVLCLPPIDEIMDAKPEDTVMVTGRVAPVEGGSFELRTEHIEKISKKEFEDYDKYLKLRGELLIYGA